MLYIEKTLWFHAMCSDAEKNPKLSSSMYSARFRKRSIKIEIEVIMYTHTYNVYVPFLQKKMCINIHIWLQRYAEITKIFN